MNNELLKLIKDNENLIYKFTHYFTNYSSKEDLFQVGCVGLIKAYNNYSDQFNTKFTTYAYPYILGEIKKYIREDKGIKISRDITKLNLKIEKANLILTQKLMHIPTTKELASYLELDEYYISEALNSNNVIQSLDEPIIDNGKELTLYDTVSNIETMDIDMLLALKQELSQLNEKDYKIISGRYLEDKTQTELARTLGINQVQVSRQEQKILTKLKDKLAA